MSANGDPWFQHASNDPLEDSAKAARATAERASIDAAERWIYGCPTCGHDQRDISGLLSAACSGGAVVLLGVAVIALLT